ncbi:hypothetical protein PFISCL1PPCAC_348, partial [Pristionchus fissidentatus]
ITIGDPDDYATSTNLETPHGYSIAPIEVNTNNKKAGELVEAVKCFILSALFIALYVASPAKEIKVDAHSSQCMIVQQQQAQSQDARVADIASHSPSEWTEHSKGNYANEKIDPPTYDILHAEQTGHLTYTIPIYNDGTLVGHKKGSVDIREKTFVPFEIK